MKSSRQVTTETLLPVLIFAQEIGPVLREGSEEYCSLPSSLRGEKLRSPGGVLHTTVAVLNQVVQCRVTFTFFSFAAFISFS